MKYLGSILGLLLAVAILAVVGPPAAQAHPCNFPHRVECVPDTQPPTPEPQPPVNCKFPSYVECKVPLPPRTIASEPKITGPVEQKIYPSTPLTQVTPVVVPFDPHPNGVDSLSRLKPKRSSLVQVN